MRKTILFFASLFAFVYINAQSIEGKLIDKDNKPVEFAVVVLQTSDSTYVNSVYSDSLGVFSFKSDLKKFRLITQHLMFETSEKGYTNSNVGSITLDEKENALNEIVVKGERPMVRIVDGRMTYDMKQLLDGKVVSNAYESLLQLPGVREQEGNLTLAGANSLTVIINGKPTTMTPDQLMQLLKNTPKERIEKAEVMYSAPPQYHIRGGAINLVMKKGESDNPQWQGQVNGAYTQKHYDSYSAGASLLYSSSNFSADFLYSLDQSKTKSGLDLYSHHLFDGSIYNIDQQNVGDRNSLTHNLRIGTDYKIDDKNKISLSYTTELTPKSKSNEFSTGTFSNTENRKEADSPIQMHNGALTYNSGFGMDAGIDYTYYKSHTTQYFNEKMTGKENVFESSAKQDINRFAAYIDQTHNLASDWSLNYGSRFAFASDNSSQVYKSLSGEDLSGSNTSSELKEYTYNMYAGFEKSFSEKLSVSASLTGEYYKHGSFKEWTLFPQLEATYVFTPSNIMQLSVSSDKVYPSYWAMQGNISYMNGYSEIHGNPDLKPYKDYSSQLTYIMNSKYTITAFANYSDNYFVQVPYQATDKLAIIYKTLNFDYKLHTGISLSIPFAIGSVSDSRLTLNGYYDKVKSDHFHDIAFTNDNWAMYSQLNNTINISSKPNIKMEINGRYTTQNIQGPMTIGKLWAVDAGIKWSFAKNNAELKLKGTDLFNCWTYDLNAKYLTQNFQMNMLPDSRSAMLSFSYKFGGYKNKERKDVDTSRFGK